MKKYFPTESKSKVAEIATNLNKAFRIRIQNADCMDDSTKARALEKLDMMLVMVEYSDKLLDYSGLEIKNDSYVMNVMRARNFVLKHDHDGLDKAEKPVDRILWGWLLRL